MAAEPVLDGEQWRAALATRFNGLTPSAGLPDQQQDPMGRVHSIGLDDLSVHRISGTRQILVRTAPAIRRHPSDLLKVCLMVRGRATIEQSGAEVSIGPGEFALYDTGRPYRVTNHSPWQVSVMTVARHDLSVSQHRLAELLHRPIDAATGPGQVYASYLASIVSLPDGPELPAAGHVRVAGIALLSAALTQRLDRAVEIDADVVADQLVRHVEANIDDLGLSMDVVAARYHMSVRSLQRLLAGRGVTFSSLVRRRRLEAVRRDLADHTLARRSIAAVAARWGVVDQPWLSRNFRAAYGVSPSDFRRDALGLSAASAGPP